MNSSRQNLQNIKGFTILEFLIAAFILIVVVGSISLLLKESSFSFSQGKSKVGIYEAGRQSLNFLMSRLCTALVNDWKNNRINFIGEEKKVKFICPFSTRKDSSDICKIIFYLDGKELKVWLKRMGKEEKDYSFSDSLPGSQGLITNVQEMTFEYYDGISWRDCWDSRKGKRQDGRLPKAVRIKIKISAPKGIEGKEPIEKSFSAITYLENRG